MRLAIVINEYLTAPAAHMLYIMRLASCLAQTRPQSEIHLLFLADKTTPSFESRGLAHPKNLFLHPLPAVRKRKKRLGLTLNAVFYHFCLWELQKIQPDVIFSASYPKLWKFLLDHRRSLPRANFAYEVHGLVEINPDPTPEKIAREIELFKRTDILWTTTDILREFLARHGIKSAHLPYGCPMHPDDFPDKTVEGELPAEDFRLGYFGSVYPEQGVDWLVEKWQPTWGRLYIAGGTYAGENVISYGRVPHKTITDDLLPNVDALVIPALRMGRTPYVYFTKAYDYLAFRRPIIASNLPSIAEVLRDGQEALLFEPGDEKSFLAALEKIRTDGVLRARLINNCIARAKELSYEKSVKHFWELVDAPHCEGAKGKVS